MTGGVRETEIKLAAPDAASALARLEAAGFRVSKPRVFESNVVLDGEGLPLRCSGRLLRLREAGGANILTYKGPADAGKHKSREELELEIPSAATMTAILERLGFTPAFRYEKFRTEFRLSSAPAGIATLDETPIGVYMELEGEPEWIDAMAQRLGFSEAGYITTSYARLYLEWCERKGIAPTHMVFAGS
jgi:adenylate cyclase, class 2